MAIPEGLRPLSQEPNAKKGGYLNTLHFWEDTHGKKYLSRKPLSPLEQAEVIEGVNEEYRFNKFFAYGGSWRLRTPEEQIAFTQQASALKLPVVPFFGEIQSEILMPYIEGVNVRDYLGQPLPQDKVSKVIYPALDSITTAHSYGLIYGDRWTNNMVMDLQGNVHQIDFDIHLTGPRAKEYELAQFLYSVVRDTHNTLAVVPLMKDYFHNRSLSFYDFSVVADILTQYGQWFETKHPTEPQRIITIQKSLAQIAKILINK